MDQGLDGVMGAAAAAAAFVTACPARRRGGCGHGRRQRGGLVRVRPRVGVLVAVAAVRLRVTASSGASGGVGGVMCAGGPVLQLAWRPWRPYGGVRGAGGRCASPRRPLTRGPGSMRLGRSRMSTAVGTGSAASHLSLAVVLLLLLLLRRQVPLRLGSCLGWLLGVCPAGLRCCRATGRWL